MFWGILLSVCIHPILIFASSPKIPRREVYRIENSSYTGNILSTHETSLTSIKLKWKLNQDFGENLVEVIVKYRPRRSRPKLLWNGKTNYETYDTIYFTDELYETNQTFETKTYPARELVSKSMTPTDRNELIVAVDNLLPDTLYNLILRRIAHDSKLSAEVSVSTKANDIPKPGAGCFSVVDSSYDPDSNRLVKIHWKNETGLYQFRLYDDSGILIGEGTGKLNSEIVLLISPKRHYVQLTLKPDRTVISETNSTIEIPASRNIISLPKGISLYLEINSQSITWHKPKNIQVTNYTIFLMDANPELSRPSIIDFVYLPGERTSFDLKKIEDKNLRLAMSINTENASSGLVLLPYPSLKVMHSLSEENENYRVTVRMYN